MPDSNNGDIPQYLLKYGIDIGFILSGFFGALLLSLNKRRQSLLKHISTIVAGTACANYLTPVLLHFLPESIHDKGKYAAAFMMGYIGLKGLEFIIDIVTEQIRAKFEQKPVVNEACSKKK